MGEHAAEFMGGCKLQSGAGLFKKTLVHALKRGAVFFAYLQDGKMIMRGNTKEKTKSVSANKPSSKMRLV